MKTAFAAALALSLLSGTAIAAPGDARSEQGQTRPDRGDNQDRSGQDRSGQDRSGQDRPNRGDQQGQNNQGQNNGNGQGNGGGQAQNDRNGRGNGQTQNDGRAQNNDNRQGNGQTQNQNRINDNGNWDRTNRGGQWGQNNVRRDRDARPRANHRQYSYKAPRGYDARRTWNRGDRLPEGYRHRAYVVDHRAYHLARPSYGYQWVRVGNNVYLVRASNGVVAQIVWNMFY